MTDQPVRHATFAVERTYDAAPARVFAAWAKPEAKARWFSCHDAPSSFEMDFRTGGREAHRIMLPGGPVYRVDIAYHDIVPDRRIVYVYDMHVDDLRVSVSLVTVELTAAGGGTRLAFTEQAGFLDGRDASPERAHGTGTGLDRLAEELRRAGA